MRRVSWPDEEGYWWIIAGDAVLACPIHFYYANGEYVPSSGDYAPYHNNRWKFEGPIPKPRIPMRFEIEGKANRQIIGSHAMIYIGKDRIPEAADGKRFKITFEEIL